MSADETPPLQIEVLTPDGSPDRDADTVVVRLAGELDMSNIEQVEAQVAPALAAGPRTLVVQADELAFADSSAIAMWLRWSANVENFELRDPTPLLRRVLTAMGLAEKLGIPA